MRVAFVLFRYFAFGGMQRDMLRTAERCAARGHEVTIFCYRWDGERPEAVPVELLATSGTSNHRRAIRFQDALRARLAEVRPDVVIGFDKLAGLDLYFAADPCFVTRTAHRPALYRWLPRYRTFRNLERACFATSSKTRILLLSEAEREPYQRVWQTPDERFTLLPPGIARDRCKTADAEGQRRSVREPLGIPDDHRLALLLGANFRLKGLDRALHAIAALPDDLRATTHLLAVGQEPPRWARDLADDLGVTPNVTMQSGRDDVPSLLQGADFLLHPAHRDTTGTVLLEAICAELPVLCSDVCGYAPHVIASKAGHAVGDWGRATSGQARFEELASQDLTPLQNAALAYAQQHDLHAMHDVICDEIERIAK